MAGIRNQAKRNGKYQGWFVDMNGKRKFFTGTHDRRETLRMAERLEDEHLQIRLGYREPKSSSDRHKTRLFSEVVTEYIAWGESQGGRGGRPWATEHARKRRDDLHWWQDRLGIQTLGELNGILPRMEKALRELQAAGRAGKTLQNRQESICAFCDWALERGYLPDDPLRRAKQFDITPRSRRRLLTEDEIHGLLGVVPAKRRLLYQVAMCTGLRAKELRSLKVRDLNAEMLALNLHAEWTKNRQPGMQPIPQWLFEELVQASKGKDLDDALFEVHKDTSTRLDKDLASAHIPKWTPNGKIDFHALRNVYVSNIIEAGATVKEAQSLARHSTPNLTINTYARASQKRLSELAEKASEGVRLEQKCAISVHHTGKAPELKTKFVNDIKEIDLSKSGARRGN